MTIQDAIRDYLEIQGMSQRALSLNAGLNAKAVSDILNIRGLRPRHSTLVRLSQETGLDLVALSEFGPRTYADLVQGLETQRLAGRDASKNARQIKRINWLMRQTGWVLQTRVVCRAEILDFFARVTPAEVGLSPGSLATYKSEILGTLAGSGQRARARSVMDIDGVWGDLRDAIGDSDLKDDLRRVAGPFLVYLADRAIQPKDVTQETLLEYFHHRISTGSKSEVTCRKHVKRVANLCGALAREPRFARFSCAPVSHPFPDGREKFSVSDCEISALLEDWDRRVAPWARGQLSRVGQVKDEFIASLDDREEEMSEAQLRRRARRAKRNKGAISRTKRCDDLLKRQGFLTGTQCWSEKTALNRRGYIAALAKAYIAATDERIESIEELTDPDVLEEAIDSLCGANSSGEFDSDYAVGILKTMRKIAVGLFERDEADLEDIDDLLKEHATGRRGIAPRNKAKLRQFTPARIQKMIDLPDLLVADVNRVVEARRQAYRRKHGSLLKPAEAYNLELVRDVMVALAHSIMMKRGPRSANLIGIRLDWIRWQEGIATIVVPANEIKMRQKSDPDLPIPLGPSVSRLLRAYLEKLREKALLPGDEQNPFLFPGQDCRNFQPNRPYMAILQRLTRCVHRIVGVGINPHLYRHLIGWIWLRDDLDNLPKVQRLLGHKSLQTTIDHYAEIDEELALDAWQQRLDRQAA